MIDKGNTMRIQKDFKNLGQVCDVNEMIGYFIDNTLAYDDEHSKLFKDYLDRYSSYVNHKINIKTNKIDTYEVFGALYDFYRGKGNYNKFISKLKKDNSFAFTDVLLEGSTLQYRDENGHSKSDISIFPSNNEDVILTLVHEIEHAREAKMLEDKDLDFLNKYTLYGTLSETFPRLRGKEMALYLIENGYDKENVISSMDYVFHNDILAMDKYLKLGKKKKFLFKDKSLDNVSERLSCIPYGYGEILSSTIFELCDGDFELSNEIQKELISVRGPGYSSELLNTIGCSRENLIENGGKVLKKIYNK